MYRCVGRRQTPEKGGVPVRQKRRLEIKWATLEMDWVHLVCWTCAPTDTLWHYCHGVVVDADDDEDDDDDDAGDDDCDDDDDDGGGDDDDVDDDGVVDVDDDDLILAHFLKI